MKAKAWLSAVRLRTLPLSVSGILVGTALAGIYGHSNPAIFSLAILTTLGFQITSNLANDYGDGVKGTDNADRIGPQRAYQSGALSNKELKTGIVLSVGVTLIFIVALIYLAFSTEILYLILFAVFGVVSIWAAIRYTVGNSAYGYRGLGDIFVFCFFGLLSVLGSMFLFTKYLTFSSVLPATAIGLLSTAVLNLNNLRDFQSDKKSNKNTLVVKLGFKNAKRYHYGLLIASFLCMTLFMYIQMKHWYNAICMVAYLPLFNHLLKVYRTQNPLQFDPELKKVALSTFFLAVFFYLGFNIFL